MQREPVWSFICNDFAYFFDDIEEPQYELMLKAILIDDEENARIALKVLIEEQTSGVSIVGMYSSLKEASSPIIALRPEVVFLDIQMPEENGLELWRYFPKPFFNVVFTTAFHQYAIQAIRLAAFDYLLKPIDIEELENVVTRLKEQRSYKNVEQRLEVLEGNMRNSNTISQIVLPTQESLEMVKLENIIRAESDDNYTYFFLADGTKLLVSKTLKEYENLLPKTVFLRIHQSHLVNLKFVKKYLKGKNGFVEMIDGQKLPVSRERRDDLIDLMGRI